MSNLKRDAWQIDSTDLATIAGLLGGLALVATAMLLGGSFGAFLDLPSILIVLGGTFSVTMIGFSVREVARAQSVMLKAVFQRLAEPDAAARLMLKLAEKARKDGVLSLQGEVGRLTHDPFLMQAISLVVDGTPGEEVERILKSQIAAMAQRHRKSAGVFRRAAEVAPAMGLIGTLIGLVQMLGTLDDPGNIGPAMAVALLTTFYGAILGTMVFAPLAAKLERNSEEEFLLHSVYLMGAASIGRQENPRRLEMLLNTLLPPASRVRQFD